MAQWHRENPWRQGHVLKADSAKALGICNANAPDDTIVLVISHDCDLAQIQEVEPDCEVMVGLAIDPERMDGNFAFGKHPRKLHLQFRAGTTQIVGSFEQSQKGQIPKDALGDHLPADNVALDAHGLSILQTWLSARYRRSAFPTEFDRRLSEKKTDKLIAKLLKTTGDHVAAIFFDVDDGKDIPKDGADDTYKLTIYLLHSVEEDPQKSEKIATEVAKAISELFDRHFRVAGKWQYIELITCETISEAGMTVREARLYKKWHADDLSLRDAAQKPPIAI